jgi:O-antigen ligase
LGAAWDEGLLLAAVALILWGALVTGRLRLRTVPVLVPALCALAAAVGSVVVWSVPGDVGLFGLRVTLEPVLFYFVGFLLCTTGPWVRRTVVVFLASTTGLALHGLYQYITRVPTPTRWVDASENSIVTRAFSVIGNPNGLGSVLAIGFLVGLALLLSPSLRRGQKLLVLVMIGVQLAGLAVTFSRGAWLGVACGLLAMLVLAYRRYLLPVAVVGVAGLLAAPRVFVDRFLLVFSESYLSKAAVDGRIYRWTAALDQIAAHPWFGLGLGTFGGSSAARFDYWNTWIDNFYLQLGAEGGLLLLAAFLWMMLRVAKGLVKGSRVGADPFVRALAAGMFGALVAVSVANVFASVFETLAVGAALWLLAGSATAAALGEAAKAD